MIGATPATRGTDASAPALRLSGIAKSFGSVRALVGVALTFHAGKTTGLLGENGAGKSTLLRVLSGDHQPDDGVIELDGEAVVIRSPRHAHELGIHVVYQEPELVPHLTVAENLFLGALPSRGHTVRPRDVVAAAAELIAEYGFESTLDPEQLVESCSPAQRQCVEILKAVRGGARVLCLDEPTSSLSEEEAQRLWTLMGRLRSEGAAIIYVSHRMSEISRLCDDVAIMRDGVVVAERPMPDITEDEIVRLMVGRELSQMFPHREPVLGDTVLRVRGLTTRDVRDIDLDIRAGEIVGLSGLVGAGRTELAEALYGATPVLSGTIELVGRQRAFRSPRAAIRHGIGLAPEDRRAQGLFLDRSVSDNVSLTVLPKLTTLHVVRRREERDIVTAMTTRMRVKAGSLEAPVRTLSGGNQQKVLLSRWVARNPRLLILDEPTRGIDVGVKAEIYHLIDALTQEGMAVLVISSELPELIGLADRTLVMRDGRIVGETAREDATEEHLLRLALGVDEGEATR